MAYDWFDGVICILSFMGLSIIPFAPILISYSFLGGMGGEVD